MGLSVQTIEGGAYFVVAYRKLKKKSLAISIGCVLALGCAPQFWSIAGAAEVGASVTVEADAVQETTADPSGQLTNYTDVTVQKGGRWRPMDAIMLKSDTGPPYNYITTDKLNVESGGIIDLTWQETPNPVIWNGNNYFRDLVVTDAALADGTVFRIGGVATSSEYAISPANKITLGSATNPVAGGGTLYIQLGNIIRFDPLKINRDPTTFGGGGMQILEMYEKAAGQFKIVGQAAYLDAPLNIYKVTPIISSEEQWAAGYTTLYANLLDYTFDNTGLLSESAKTAGDMQLAMRNLWRVENANAFHHLDELHAPGTRRREGIWTNAYSGKFTNKGSYGRSVREDYHGLQVGFDKERAGDFYGGKLYNGLFFQQTQADTGVHAGGGDSESGGFGVYSTWLGHNGRYVDVMLRASKLQNDYFLYSNGSKLDGSNRAWAYGLNARCGLRQPLAGGWFWEPQAGMAVGQIDRADYTTSNGLRVAQSKVNVLTGQLGVLAGRSLRDNNGNIYAKLTVNHDFLDGGSLQGSYSDGTQAIETGAGKDTWCELAVGVNTKISNLRLLRTFGGDVKTDWQVNGGFNWRWSGFGSRKKTQAQSGAAATITLIPSAPTAVLAVGAAPADDDRTPPAGEPGQQQAADRERAAEPAGVPQDKAGESKPTQAETSLETGVAPEPEDNAVSGYVMDTVVVEAPRPQWEDKLSPGTVTVIEPDKYKGEQKTLPDLLKEVPGIHVRSLNGIGQYTTVSVRGSTASQVGVFVDGVLSNLGGDAAVDISTIPVKNVARIEVYRGYVPARFGGTYMGGVINIVTKKPEKTDVSASYGQRSWGGYSGSVQLDAPLGSGTLMVGINRDQSDGDFRYTNFAYQQNITDTLAGQEYEIAGYEKQIAQGEITADDPYYIEAKNKLAYLKNLSATRHRMNNSYENTDALLKWQDEHWLVKAGWKQIDRLIPAALGSSYGSWDVADVPDASDRYKLEDLLPNPRRRQQLAAGDILIGRRAGSGNLEWGWNVNYLDQDKRYSNPDIQGYPARKPLAVWSAYDSRRTGAALDGTFKAANHMLEFLANVSRETMDVDGSRMDDEHLVAYNYWKKKYRQTLLNIQLQDTITLNEAGDFWLTPMLRYNSSDVFGKSRFKDPWHAWTYPDERQRENRVTWQLALKKKVDDSLTLRTSYGSYYRLLNMYEIAGDGAGIIPYPRSDMDGSAYPRPEEGMQWDVGAVWQGKLLKADADLSLTYFSRRSDNLLQLLQYGFDCWCYMNAGDGRANGVELQNNLTWDKWDLNLSATYVNARKFTMGHFIPPSWHTSPLTYTPEWEGKLRLTYRPDNTTALFTEINYTGEQYSEDCTDKNTSIQAALTTVGLGCRYKLDKNARLVAGVNDLFDKGPAMKAIFDDGIGNVTKSNVLHPLQGRTYYMTLQYDF